MVTRAVQTQTVGGFIPGTQREYRKEYHLWHRAYGHSGRRRPLPYESWHAYIKNLQADVLPNGNPYGPAPDALNSQGGSSTFASSVVRAAQTASNNKAYAKMVEKVRGERVALSQTILEGREALNMIVNRSGQMTRAFRHLARGRFWLFLAELRIKNALPKHHGMRWNRPKDASSLWLEYHFGWSPLIADIAGAVGVLQDPIVLWQQRFRVRSQEMIHYSYRQPGRDPVTVANGPIRLRTSYQLVAVIENPNFHRANQLGFTNPGVNIWESVPFSFLIDWFYPVGAFLASANDFYGVTRRDAQYTETYRAVVRSRLSAGKTASFDLQYTRTHRYMGNIGFVPQSVFKRLSYTRAATAVSLLVQVFKGKLT